VLQSFKRKRSLCVTFSSLFAIGFLALQSHYTATFWDQAYAICNIVRQCAICAAYLVWFSAFTWCTQGTLQHSEALRLLMTSNRDQMLINYCSERFSS